MMLLSSSMKRCGAVVWIVGIENIGCGEMSETNDYRKSTKLNGKSVK